MADPDKPYAELFETSVRERSRPRSRTTSRPPSGSEKVRVEPGGRRRAERAHPPDPGRDAQRQAQPPADVSQRVARCHAATEAASRISLARIIRSTSARAKRRAIRPCSVCSSACARPGSSPVARHTSTGWLRDPVGEVRGGRGAPGARPAGPSPRPARRARAPRRTRRRSSSQAPCGNSQKRSPTGWRYCWTSQTCPSSSGTIDRRRRLLDPAVEPGRAVRAARCGPRGRASSGSRRRRGSR